MSSPATKASESSEPANDSKSPDQGKVIFSERVWGVTIDSIEGLDETVEALRALPKKPTTRIVFDEFVAASNYVEATDRISGVSYVMGEILDSYYVKKYTTKQYTDRAIEYWDALANKVDLWEVGNEVNGEWLGKTFDVVNKISGAYDVVKARGGKTALTLYYNQDCWENKSNEMFTWAQANVPARMKQGLDYVWISYYEDDCNGLKPDWNTVFAKLAKMFPNSKIGIGESGTTKANKKADYLTRYYSMKIDQPQFVGGNFWWYFKQDMVPRTSDLWRELNSLILSQP